MPDSPPAMTLFDRFTYRLWMLWLLGAPGTLLSRRTAYANNLVNNTNTNTGNKGAGKLFDTSGLDSTGIPGPKGADSKSIIDIIVKVLIFVLDFIAILAVIFIIIAGIRLIVSQGEEEQKEKAKKTIIYVIIGLIVIVLARVIVGIVAALVANI